MNRRCHRLVFSRRLGMRVAVAEHASAQRKSAGGACRAAVVALLVLPAAMALAQTARAPVVFASKLAAPKNNLPVANTNPGRSFVYEPAKGDPLKGGASADLSGSGQVRWSVNGNSATFDQGKVERVVINWDSFDIGAGYKVHFAQDKDPTKYVSALNRIWSLDPSVILGSLTADREVILVNANGVYFGRGARVATGSFVATANNIADAVFEKGLRNIIDGTAVFGTSAVGDYAATQLDAGVSVEAGAEIRSAAGGDVLLIAPRVVNQGRIATPNGQTVLAAGDKVYLMSSSDPAQRGLIVAVDPVKSADGSIDTTLGTVENAARGSYKTLGGATVDDTTPDSTSGLVQQLNEIRADSGSVNLVGLAVKQNGVINATTAVKGANGAIYLQAMASTQTIQSGRGDAASATGRLGLLVDANTALKIGFELGSVEFGAGSTTAVTPSTGLATQIDAEVFNASRIRVEGKNIAVDAGALVQAAAGRIELLAANKLQLGEPIFDNTPSGLPVADDGSRIVIAPNATVSVAGLRDVAVDGARNQGAQRLFRIELADAPVQRDGPLYRSQVYFDLRDGSKIDAADVSGAAASIARTAAERSAFGGTLRVETLGSLVVGEDATLDVSGGSLEVSEATLRNTLVQRNGTTMAFSNAAAGNRLDTVLANTAAKSAPAYTEGKSGGTLTLSGRNVAVAGDLRGSTIEGERQRDGSDARAAAAKLVFGRSVEGNYLLQSLQLAATRPTIDSTLFSDPLTAAITLAPDSADLALATLRDSGFGAVSLNAAHVTQTGQGDLDLGTRGQLAITANSIALDGRYTAHGGSIALSTNNTANGAGDIVLSANTRLDVSGLWTNDSVAGQQAGAAAADIQVNSGTVSVAAARSALLAPGAAIDVSGGARLSASGALTQGMAGSISLATSRNIDVDGQLTLAGVSLRGHDFKSGGTLNIGAPQLTVSDSSSDSDSAAKGLTLAPAFFSAGGFGNIAVTAFGDIRFASGTVLQPQLLNWQLDADYRRAGSGTMTAAVASPTLLDTRLAERKPVNLSFVASRPLVPGDARQTGGALSVERGARIALDPGARLTLAATDGLQVGASGGSAGQTSELLAPGGNITLRIDGVRGVAPQTTGDATGYLPTQALWLGADAKLSVSGTAVLRPTSTATASTVDTDQAATPLDQRVKGTVYGGGSITLQANRGYVVAQAGSSLALDGAVANLHFAGIDSAVPVAKAAGTLTVSSPEGFALEGSISARAPSDSQGRALADGGRLDLAVGAGGVATNTESGRPYPGTVFDSNGIAIPGALAKPRELRLGGVDTMLIGAGAQPGDDVQALLDNGIGRASQALLTQSGFSGYRFASGDRVSFSDKLTLHAGLAIAFDTPVLSAAAGKQVSLSASSARLGDGVLQTAGRTPLDTSSAADSAAGQDTTLSIAAPTIELVGNSALQGFSTVTLAAGARGEIRLMGAALATQLSGSTVDTGSLNFAGTLNLQAAQVYSISGADFAFNGLAGDSRFAVRGSGDGSTAALPLSAFGALTVNATDIDQGGVLRQPFGAITLNASNSLRLGENSLTSVASDGASLLHGTTDNLSRWLLPSTGLAATQLPLAKGVTLNAAQISTASSARVDAKGGGDVLASEFFAGVGGSRDSLALDGLYAVLPDYATTRALAADGGRLAAASEGRELVVTMAGSGLAPGRYTLMPARLALLGGVLPQGAYIVSRASDQGKTVLASAQQQDDGSSIVTGYFSTAGSINTGAPGERFVVAPLSTFSARSDNRLTSVSKLLDSQSAGAGVRGTPRDGGRVQLSVTGSETSLWNAGINLAADGGAAGLLDISATRLALVDDLAKTAAGTLGVAAAVVNDSGAGSVLLGGLRSDSTAAGTLVTTVDTTKTNAVTLDLGALALDVEELILASRDSITLAAGSTVRASRTATLGDRTLSTAGGGALAVVSANRLDVQRSGAVLGSGSVQVGARSLLSGTQLAFDTAGSLAVDGSSQLSAQALALGGRRLVVGNGASADADAAASVVDAGLLDAARKTPELSLRSYSSIDFVGVQDWAARAGGSPSVVARSLVLDSPVVRGVSAADGTPAAVDIAAQSIVLRNTTGQAPSAADIGGGTLTLQAVPALRYGSTGGMALGPGELRLGFAQTELRSGGDIVLQGSGGTTAQGDLTLASARVTASTGANQRVQAETGALRINTLAGSRTLGEHVGQGAQVSLIGTTLTQAGNIDLPGGALTLSASGVPGSSDAAVQLAAGSRTSVAGYVLPGHDGFEAHGLAGTVRVAAASGSIDIDGQIDVSAALRADGTRGSGDAGQVLLSATGSGGTVQVSGQIAGHAGSGTRDRGGSIAVDVSTLTSLDGIAGAAASGGLDHALTARVRNGNVAITAGVRAEQLRVSADAGQLSVGSVTLDAHADTGGVVQLSAGGNLSLAAGAVIDARSTRAGANGGDVLLNSAAGRVHLDTTASIDTRGDDAQDGRIVLRALRDGSAVRVDTLNTARLQGAEVDIEAVRVYSSVTSGSVTANITSINTGNSAVSGSGASASGTLGQTTLRNDNNSYMSAASGALAALGVTDTARVHLRAGVEVRAVNDLAIAADWALNAERPGGDAGFLTLRAGGNINVNGSLSDGFSSAASTAALLTGSPRAWSVRLAAGADLGAADPLAVRDLASTSSETGNLTIAANKVVRTGAGAIELAAGRDIRFAGSGTAASGSAYVAGRRIEGEAALLGSLFADQAAKPSFTEQGGRLTLQAGRDITAPEATQLINNWFWRSGLVSSSAGEADLYNSASQLAWWSEFPRWRQTLGSMGGGDLTVAAGRNIENLQAMVPTSGWADSRDRLQATLQVRNGGDLDVQAGGSVLGGQYFVGRGEGRLEAGASIAARGANSRVDAPILALMDGDWRLAARDTVAIAAAFNPTAMAAASTDNRAAQSGFFYSWSGNESLDLRTATGGVALLAGAGGGELGNYGLASDPRPLAAVLPSTLSATAAGGAIDLSGASALLFPSVQGQLALWAGTDIAMGNAGAAGRTLAMGDSSLALWPDATRPLANAQLVSDLTGASGLITSSIAGNLASAALHQGDDSPVQLHAEGSLRNGTLRLAKAATLSAGQDLLDLSVLGLNLDAGDTTSIAVQRDLVQTLTGALISIGGPGSLEVTAGRNLDLGASAGITTTGNVGAPTLPALGANIRVAAATQGTLNLANFDAAYLDTQANSVNPRASANRDLLLAFVRDALQQPTLNYAQAWALFQQFPASAQAQLGRKVLAAEFAAVYLDSAASTAQMTQSLRLAFERNKAQILLAGEQALLGGSAITLPGREVLRGAALAAYLAELRALNFTQLDLDSTVQARVMALAAVRDAWRAQVAARLGSSAAALDTLARTSPQDPQVLAFQAALADRSSRSFEAYRQQVLASEIASTGAVASQFGRKTLPMRLALFDQGFQAAELTGAGSFVAQPIWAGTPAAMDYSGTLDLTLSAVVSERGGNIDLVNAGGAINVGLKAPTGTSQSAKGVITLGGGDIFGYARDDFQVNTQRVFVVGQGDMTIWSSRGDIDSGRGANTAVAAPPLQARRTADGIVFETPATTTGSGLGILEDTSGRRAGSIGLFPAFGEILALDAFIRAPSIVLGATVRGADNIQSPSVGGAAAPVSAPPPTVAAPPSETRAADAATAQPGSEARPRNSLLTVELLGLGASDETCSEAEERDRGRDPKCQRPPKCSDEQKAAGQCK